MNVHIPRKNDFHEHSMENLEGSAGSRGETARSKRSESVACRTRDCGARVKQFYYLLRTRTRLIPVRQPQLPITMKWPERRSLPTRDERDNLLAQSNLLLPSVFGCRIAKIEGVVIEKRRMSEKPV